jgi:hypothetical protein
MKGAGFFVSFKAMPSSHMAGHIRRRNLAGAADPAMPALTGLPPEGEFPSSVVTILSAYMQPFLSAVNLCKGTKEPVHFLANCNLLNDLPVLLCQRTFHLRHFRGTLQGLHHRVTGPLRGALAHRSSPVVDHLN